MDGQGPPENAPDWENTPAEGDEPTPDPEPSLNDEYDAFNLSTILPRPLLNDFDWGPLPTKHDYKFAHRLWSLPNKTLEYYDYRTKERYGTPRRDSAEEFLVRNVYADLVEGKNAHYMGPWPAEELATRYPDAHAPPGEEGSEGGEGVERVEGWTYQQLGELAPVRRYPAADEILIAGRKKKGRWLKRELTDQLELRGFGNRWRDENWTVARCKEELYAYEATKGLVPDSAVDIFPRQELTDWGVKQRRHVDSCVDADYGSVAEDCLSPFRLYTWALHLSPYNPTYWVSRAYLFHQKGFYDLAIGDAYRALMLEEVLRKGRTTAGIYARVWDAIENHVYANAEDPHLLEDDWNDRAGRRRRADAALAKTREPQGILCFLPHLRRTIYHIISLNMLSLHSWREWIEMDQFAYESQRDLEYAYYRRFRDRYYATEPHANRRHLEKKRDLTMWHYERWGGAVSGRAFPQSAQDIDRTSQTFLTTLNAAFLGPWPGKNDRIPAIEVRRKANGELGVFALKAFEQGELIHVEEPSVRGQARRVADMADKVPLPNDTFCENCKRPINDDQVGNEAYGIDAKWSRLDKTLRDQDRSMCHCIGVEKMGVRRYFCPPVQHDLGPPIGLGIEGMPLEPQQPTVSTLSDQHEAATEAGGGLSARAPRSSAGKRKVTDGDGTDQPRAKRTTRSTRVTRSSLKKSGAATGKPRVGAEAPEEGQAPPEEQAPTEEQEPVAEEPESTCLQKARETYHFKSCGKNWGWLHKQLRMVGNDDDEGIMCDDYQRYGSHLSLLLLDVFDRTLLLRTSEANSHILPHEIDEMLPLCGGDNLPEQYFPFTYVANIIVPFDVLLTLGVNIFREMDFDTWVIQTVMRKLLLNCVPWDDWRRGRTDDIDIGDESRGSFETLYVHTGAAMFNHACDVAANSDWFWDRWTENEADDRKGIPNRMIIRANRAIAADEEIKLKYYPGVESKSKQQRLFGRNCDCHDCSTSPAPEPER